MNNKGFTLIELLIVVAILGTVGIIITVNLNKTLTQNNEDECNYFIKEVEDAACAFVNFNDQTICHRDNCRPIPLSALIEKGLIKSEINACTNEKIDENATVSVTWTEEGEKVCKYDGR